MNINYYNGVSRYLKNMDIVSIKTVRGPLDIPLMFKTVKFSNNDIQFFYNVSDNEAGRIDAIATKVYGNSKLWWAIAIANQIEDSLVEPISGRVLKIPSVSAVQRWL